MHVVVSGHFLVAGEIHRPQYVNASRVLHPAVVAERSVLLHRVPAPPHHDRRQRLNRRPAVRIARDDVIVPQPLRLQRQQSRPVL